MFDSIEINQYRGIKHLKIENLRQFNLVVGATNIGKTSLLEALFLAINPDNLSLIFTINSARKIPYTSNFLRNLFYKADPLNTINIIAKTKEKGNNIRDLKYYAIQNQENPINLEEKSPIPTASSTRPSIDKLSLVVNNIPEVSFTLRPLSELEKGGNVLFKPFIKEILTDNPYKMTFNGRFEHSLSYTGSFSAKYDGLVENMEKEEFLNLIRNIDPKINSLEKTDKGILIDYGFKKPIPIEALGRGMIKIITIMAAIFNTKKGVVLIDELENGMHYELLDLFWKAIFKTASNFNVQIIATTHSYDCIRSFYNKHQNNEILLNRLEKENDIHESMAYNSEEIKILIEEDMEVR